MSLHFDVHPNSDSEVQGVPIVILPGLFGSSSNWRSFAKQLCDTAPVFVLDLRNHGRSPHYESHRYVDMAKDIKGFCDEHGLNKVIACGHSMGGKAAMTFALLFPEYVTSLIVLDIVPVKYSHSHAPFLDALLKIDLQNVESRKQVDQLLQASIPEQSTRLFLLQSLTGRPGQFKWRLNLAILKQFMPEIADFPHNQLAGKCSNTPTLLVYGGNSEYVDDAGIREMIRYFNGASVHMLEGAGHWLHIDQPRELLGIMKLYIRKVKKND